MSYEDEDTCTSYEEEDTCMCMRVYGTMHEYYACHMRMRIHAHHMRRICMSYEEDMLEISCLRCAVTHYIA
jgi:hypothetical protein